MPSTEDTPNTRASLPLRCKQFKPNSRGRSWERYQRCCRPWGSLFKSLRLAEGERLLIRGGTTSVGLAAAAIAKNHRAFVAATTRNPGHTELLRSTGVDDVIVDAGSITDEVQRKFPGGVD